MVGSSRNERDYAASSSRSSSTSRAGRIDNLDSIDHVPSSLARDDARKAASTLLEGRSSDRAGDAVQRRSPPERMSDPEGALLKFIEHLTSAEHQDTEPHLTAVGYELEALVSIYTPSAVKLSFPSRPPSIVQPTSDPSGEPSVTPSSASMGKSDSQQWRDSVWNYELGYTPGERIRYEVDLPVWEEGETLEGVDTDVMPDQAPVMRVLVSLPPTYPNSSPPQLQLLGRYLGSFSIDSGLFGEITRTYISSNGVPFTPGDVCVFEGLTHVQTVVREWYTAHLQVLAQGEAERRTTQQVQGEDNHLIRGMSSLDVTDEDQQDGYEDSDKRPQGVRSTFSYSSTSGQQSEIDISHLKIHTSEAIVDRKSTFVGHAVRVTDEKEVPLVVHQLLEDKKIARAAHPAIFAYRIARQVGGPAGKVYDSDYDDDGETAAGARLKHLIEILELENVLVVVTRWFGGIHLGPDRFKHINQAARDALELGGFLEDKKDDKDSGGKRRGKR
ncbi:hypothetical protein IAU60_001450 [Kwoniella sp. DSM 27419]